jgi:hypothetical protein
LDRELHCENLRGDSGGITINPLTEWASGPYIVLYEDELRGIYGYNAMSFGPFDGLNKAQAYIHTWYHSDLFPKTGKWSAVPLSKPIMEVPKE